jgi:hypothetical protein
LFAAMVAPALRSPFAPDAALTGFAVVLGLKVGLSH